MGTDRVYVLEVRDMVEECRAYPPTSLALFSVCKISYPFLQTSALAADL